MSESPFFLDFVYPVIKKKTTFRKPASLSSSGKKERNLVDALDRAGARDGAVG